MKRYVVRPCDNLGTVEGLKRDRSWSVWDRERDQVVSDHDTRKDAREEASRLNEELRTPHPLPREEKENG